MDAIILAAGRGTRLRPLTDHTPKPLIPVAGRGTLPRVLRCMPDAVDRIILVIGHLGEQIRAAVGTEALGRDVVYVEQAPLNGTGGAVLQSAGALRSDTFLVVNGDDIFCE